MNIDPQGVISRFADFLVMPIMFALSGTWTESPQQTHFWNNQHLNPEAVHHLDQELMVHCRGIPGEIANWPLFHMPILDGWRNYVVLDRQQYDYSKPWHIGWTGKAGISQIKLYGRVRMLIGPGDVSFFGISDGNQIKIRQIGTGRIGSGGPYSKIPLL